MITGGIAVGFLILLTINLIIIIFFIRDYPERNNKTLAAGLTLISSLGLFLVAPYSFPHGVFALVRIPAGAHRWLTWNTQQLAGRRGVGTVSSFVNGAGYAAAIGAGYITGTLADNYGWHVVFIFLSACSAYCLYACAYFWYLDLRYVPLLLLK